MILWLAMDNVYGRYGVTIIIMAFSSVYHWDPHTWTGNEWHPKWPIGFLAHVPSFKWTIKYIYLWKLVSSLHVNKFSSICPYNSKHFETSSIGFYHLISIFLGGQSWDHLFSPFSSAVLSTCPRNSTSVVDARKGV